MFSNNRITNFKRKINFRRQSFIVDAIACYLHLRRSGPNVRRSPMQWSALMKISDML
jgi:hypothetical protein